MNDNGGQEFPVEAGRSNNGMTLRDYFAAAWLQGAAADPTTREWRYNADKYAKTAYIVADAMLEARK